MNKWYALLCAAILFQLNACNVVTSFTDIHSQTEALAGALQSSLGERPEIGWNINNGVLTEVSIVFSGEKFDDRTVGELRDLILQEVTANMKQKPQDMFIVISATKSQKS